MCRMNSEKAERKDWRSRPSSDLHTRTSSPTLTPKNTQDGKGEQGMCDSAHQVIPVSVKKGSGSRAFQRYSVDVHRVGDPGVCQLGGGLATHLKRTSVRKKGRVNRWLLAS